jgi:Zn finger protein HypA/HybF involved in hydrogenase expression
VIGFVIASVAGIFVLSMALSIVQFRTATPLAFRCMRCEREFQRPPHKRYPRTCPHCGARDWATGARSSP